MPSSASPHDLQPGQRPAPSMAEPLLRRRRTAVRASLLMIVFAAAAPAALAQSLYSAEVSAGANAILAGTVQPPPAELSQQAAAPFATLSVSRDANTTASAQGAYAGGSSTAWSGPDAGGLHLGTTALASVTSDAWLSPNPNASGSSVATGLFRDVFQFNVPGAAPGTAFTVAAQIRIDAGTMVDGLLLNTTTPSFFSGSTSWQTRVSMGSSSGWLLQDERQGGCQWTAPTAALSCSDPSPGLANVAFVLSTGSNVVFEMSATARSFAGAYLAGPGGASAGASVDMGHTLAWGGVQAVHDADGNAVDLYTMTGMGSGFDFRQSYASAVPEPGGVALWMLGLAAVAGLRWPRARHALTG